MFWKRLRPYSIVVAGFFREQSEVSIQQMPK
jgi:hypothetical protein